MKRQIAMIALLFLGMGMTASAQFGKKFNVGKALQAGKDVVSAVTLSDADIANMSKEYMVWMDAHNPLTKPDTEYGKRLEKLTGHIKEMDGLKLNFGVYEVVDVNAFACGDGSVRICAGLMDVMTDEERKVFDAAILAAEETKAPIYTHTTLGTCGLEQALYLRRSSLDLSRVVIGHMDLSGDLDYIRRVLATGVTIGFDTVGKKAYLPDETRVEFLKALEAEGMLVVLSMDLTRKSHLAYKGGIGYSYLIETFLPMLKEAGIAEESIQKMLVDNPKRILYGE